MKTDITPGWGMPQFVTKARRRAKVRGLWINQIKAKVCGSISMVGQALSEDGKFLFSDYVGMDIVFQEGKSL